ncbi:MAG: hypothetical protein IJB74_06585 [Clostridia bacterium]|nr:hypothetical protein [Clostridia bacterium]
MKISNKVPVTVKMSKIYSFIFRYTVSSFVIFVFAFMLLKFPVYSADGVKRGIDICLNSLIPSLYPFMILTNIYALSGLAEFDIPFTDKISGFLFRLPGKCLSVILFSFIGGLPIGATMSVRLYDRGLITREQCERMICFCVNPGPAFVISAVGYTVLGSVKAGLLIYISLILSSIIIGIITRFFSSENEFTAEVKLCEAPVHEKGIPLEKAVAESSKAMLAICGWVVAFTCITELTQNMNISEGIKSLILCVSEITNGSIRAAKDYPVPIVAAVIGFSGFCGHFQLMSLIRRAGLKYKYFLVSRIVNSGISAVICGLLFRLFPVAKETFAVGVRPEKGDTSGSVFLSVLMVVMAILFVLGDDYIVKRKNVKKV